MTCKLRARWPGVFALCWFIRVGVSCARLIMLRVDQNFKHQKLGSRLMKQALAVTKALSSLMGCYGLYLDAARDAVEFYQNLGVELLEGDNTPEPSPMFITIRSI